MCFRETGCSMWIEIAHEGWLIPIPSFSCSFQNALWSSWAVMPTAMLGVSEAVHSSFAIPALPSFHGMLWVPADVRAVLSCSLSDTHLAMLLGQCFLLCIAGLFLSSPLSNLLFGMHSFFGTEKDYSVNLLSFPSSLVAIFQICQGFLFCGWVTLSYSAVCASAHVYHTHQLPPSAFHTLWHL